MHLFDAPTSNFTIRFGLLNSETPRLAVSGPGFTHPGFTFRKAEVHDGKIIPVESHASRQVDLPAPKIAGTSPWRRIEIARLGDSLAFVIDGVLVGALADVREGASGLGKAPGRTVLQIWADSGPAQFGAIDIREISALPPEIGRAAVAP
jgi:hypothetical protein